MADTNQFSLGNLKPYTDQTSREFLLELVAKSKTAEVVAIQQGIKFAEALQYLDIDPVLQIGGSCGFNALGTTNLKQKTITVTPIKVNMDICLEKLEQIWYGYYMKKGAAGVEDTTGILNKAIEEALMKNIQHQNEINVWQGKLASALNYSTFPVFATGSTWGQLTGTSQNIVPNNLFDGFITLLSASTDAIYVSTATASTYTTSNIIAASQAMVTAVPENILEMEDLTLFMSYANYLLYIQALVNANLFHYNPLDGGRDYEIYIPGTQIKVMGVAGLRNTKYFVLTFAKNLVIGTDMISDANADNFDMWYSRDFQVVKLNLRYKLGTQVKYTEFAVINFPHA